MGLIPFVQNFDDLSTDHGFQFKFHCDKCGNGYMSNFQASAIGTAGSLLRAAGGLLGGWVSSAGNSAYEVQRMVGGTAHDDAFSAAVKEGMQRFHQCSRCGKWVCPDVCWNAQVGQCEECAPNFKEEFASAHAHAKVDAARQQLQEKAQGMNYVGSVDMSEAGYSAAPTRPTVGAAGDACTGCGGSVGAAKFCPNCGTPHASSGCKACGTAIQPGSKFCPNCGAHT
jgi:hypothetical protein